MKKLLVVVDMQNDFIDGTLGTPEALLIVPNVIKKISEWAGDIAYTMDTHYKNYMSTKEGKKLPIPHCIVGTDGWKLNDDIRKRIEKWGLRAKSFLKETFGSIDLADLISESGYDYIEFVGLCTDISVISNVLIAKAIAPDAKIVVDASCCAGVTPESHNNALEAMKMCHIDMINS